MPHNIQALLTKAVEMKASDIHITSGTKPIARVHGRLIALTEELLKPDDTMACSHQVLDDEDFAKLETLGEVDTSYFIPGVARFRLNAFRQRGSCALAFRVVANHIPSMKDLMLPPVMAELSERPRGLVLITGPTGSGKSTTLAAMVDHMNRNLNKHIITIEDPIEYLHEHKGCMVNQRQIGVDTVTFANALRAALRQDPDVILVGEMRDLETISTALTAAETGHLVLSTVHTIGADKTVDRVIDVFPPEQQQQIRVQMASVLEAVVSQQIIPRADKQGRVAAFEVMIANQAIRNLVRDGKSHQIQTIMQTSRSSHMQTMDSHLYELYSSGIISEANLLSYAVDLNMIERMLVEGA